MEELVQFNSNRVVSLLIKNIQSSLENMFLHRIKASPISFSPGGGQMFHRNESILVDLKCFCNGEEFPRKGKKENVGFLYYETSG